MKTIKVAEATELQLDWLVAKCLGEHEDETLDPLTWLYTAKPTGCWDFCTNWAQGGPIIGREGISTRLNHKQSQLWEAYIWLPTQHDLSETDSNSYTAFGMTPLIAAMRCFCSKLGDVVDIPEELCQQQSN